MKHRIKTLTPWILLAPILLFLGYGPANGAISTGSGNTFGATSAADKAIPRFNGTSGKLLQDSSILIDDTNAFEMPVLGSAPANPATGNRKLYWRGTTLYGLSSAGTETAIGGSGGVSGSNIFWDDSAIRLGLGTILPNYTLNLNRTGATDVFAQWTNGTTGTTSSDGLIMGITAAGTAYITQAENDVITFATNNTNALTIQADQDLYPLANIVSGTGTKMGLGITTTPNYPLQIYRTDGTGFAQWTDSTSGSSSGDGFLIGTSAGVGYITQQENADIRFATNNLDRLYLLSTGDLQLLAAKDLRLSDSDSSNYVGFKAPATVSANKIWTLPDADGTDGQQLTTNGSGVLSWSSAAPAQSTLGFMSYYGSPGEGSTNTNIMRWSTADSTNAGGSDVSMVQSASAGDYYLIGNSGNYLATGNIQHSSGALHVYLMVTSGALNNSQNGTDSDIRGVAVNPGTYSYPFSAVFHATAGDKVYVSCGGSINNTYSKHNRFSIARLN